MDLRGDSWTRLPTLSEPKAAASFRVGWRRLLHWLEGAGTSTLGKEGPTLQANQLGRGVEGEGKMQVLGQRSLLVPVSRWLCMQVCRNQPRRLPGGRGEQIEACLLAPDARNLSPDLTPPRLQHTRFIFPPFPLSFYFKM